MPSATYLTVVMTNVTIEVKIYLCSIFRVMSKNESARHL